MDSRGGASTGLVAPNVSLPNGGGAIRGMGEKFAANPELVNVIVRITGGSFRLIERLMTQTGRLRDINDFHTITTDLITAARQTLVIGAQ